MKFYVKHFPNFLWNVVVWHLFWHYPIPIINNTFMKDPNTTRWSRQSPVEWWKHTLLSALLSTWITSSILQVSCSPRRVGISAEAAKQLNQSQRRHGTYLKIFYRSCQASRTSTGRPRSFYSCRLYFAAARRVSRSPGLGRTANKENDAGNDFRDGSFPVLLAGHLANARERITTERREGWREGRGSWRKACGAVKMKRWWGEGVEASADIWWGRKMPRA